VPKKYQRQPGSDLLDRSPSTHFSASTTLLFPQSLGPTMPVTGAAKLNPVLSAKDLNPAGAGLVRRICNCDKMVIYGFIGQ